MAGTYATDLTTFLEGLGTETWVEPANATNYNDMTNQQDVGDTDDFIQGTNCVTGQPGPINGAGVSSLLGVGTGFTVPDDGAIFVWIKFDASVGLNDNNGVRVCIGQGNNQFWAFYHFGKENYTYGGWKCLAQGDQADLGSPTLLTDPAIEFDDQFGTPTNTYTHVGWAAATTATPSKGQGWKVDAIRYGRGTIEATAGTNTAIDNTPSGRLSSSAANFAQIAEFNDYNGGGSPGGGTASTWTDVDTGFHRLGLFQEVTGGYLWKGLLSIGTAAASVYFDAANENINVDDTRKVTDDFNRIEIRNASSTVNWNTVSIVSNAIRSPGKIEVIDNATVSFDGCSFTSLETLIFQSNSTIENTTFRDCDVVTQGSGTFTGCVFDNSASLTAALISTPSTLGSVTSSDFRRGSGDTYNAVDIGTITASGTTTASWNGNTLVSDPTSEWEGAAGTGISSTANGAIKVTFTGTNVMTLQISVLNGATLPTVEIDSTGVTGGGSATVNVVADITITLTNIKNGSEVRVYDSEDNTAPYSTPTEIAGVEDITNGVGTSENNGTAGGTGPDDNTFTFGVSSGTQLFIKVWNVNFIADDINVTPTSSQNIQINQRTDRVVI
jgi:hypothetical protein